MIKRNRKRKHRGKTMCNWLQWQGDGGDCHEERWMGWRGKRIEKLTAK